MPVEPWTLWAPGTLLVGSLADGYHPELIGSQGPVLLGASWWQGSVGSFMSPLKAHLLALSYQNLVPA